MKFDEAMFKMEGFQARKIDFPAKKSPRKSIFLTPNQKKQVLEPMVHKNHHSTGRKLKLSHIINSQNDQFVLNKAWEIYCSITRIKRIKYNEKTNISRVLSKSAELQRRVLDCDETLDLDFYNTVSKKPTEIPEVLPFKNFRQKRFVKVSATSISKLREVSLYISVCVSIYIYI